MSTSAPSSVTSSSSMAGADLCSWPPTQSLTAESSQAKMAFMGAIGLWKVPEEEEQGTHIRVGFGYACLIIVLFRSIKLF